MVMTLTIGRRLKIEVASLEEASREYQKKRDESGEGYSTFPEGRVTGGFRISYNGRVWSGSRAAERVVMEAAAKG